MDVKILSKEIIKPSTPTPRHLRNFKLSLLNQLGPEFHVPVILFYLTNGSHLNIPKTLTNLKRALLETPMRFYPFAGRFKDLASLDCNDKGVVYVEAQANCDLSKSLANPDIQLLNKFLPCNPNHYTEKNYMSLVALQVTIFNCGGIAIGGGMSHKIGDGTTLSVFLSSWAETFRNQSPPTNPDLTSASTLFPCQPLPTQVLSVTAKYYYAQPKSKTRRFLFTAESIASLKFKSSSESVPNPTRVVALTAFIWKRLISASKAVTGKSTTSLMTHVVELRRRMDPPLPVNSVGNLAWVVSGLYDPPDQTETSSEYLAELAEIVKETIRSFDGDMARSLQGDESLAVVGALMETGDMYEKLLSDMFKFTSWINLGFYGVDFGLGKPVWVGYMGDLVSSPGKSGIVFIESGGGVEAWIILDEEKMAVLENDPEFLLMLRQIRVLFRRMGITCFLCYSYNNRW